MTEPIIPDKGVLPDDSGYSELDGKKPEDNQQDESGANGEGSERQPDNQEEVVTLKKDQYDKLVEGWREDREFYEDKIKSLKNDVAIDKLTEKEEDELRDLPEDERVNRIIAIRESKKAALENTEVEAVRSEVRFFEKTDPEFAENKKDILKTAEEYECRNLKQAMAIWRGLKLSKSNVDKQYNDNRKKLADGKPGGKSGGKTTIGGYNPKTDARKSFGDLYKEGGVS